MLNGQALEDLCFGDRRRPVVGEYQQDHPLTEGARDVGECAVEVGFRRIEARALQQYLQQPLEVRFSGLELPIRERASITRNEPDEVAVPHRQISESTRGDDREVDLTFAAVG